MLDELKVKLSTRFMRNIVSKLLAKAIYKKTGYKVNIQLKELDISVVDGETKINTNLEVNIDSNEFMKIIKSAGLDWAERLFSFFSFREIYKVYYEKQLSSVGRATA